MEKKPYSDRRWWEAPKAFDSKQLQRGFLQRYAEKESMMGTRKGAY